jgi:CDP-glucose 4,6-dehydratase
MGAHVTGYALHPEHAEGIYSTSKVARAMGPVRGDIRDTLPLRHCMRLTRPEIVFHLAAQALVRRAHRNPAATYDINVTGTQNVLDACRWSGSTRAVVVVTSDKVYENRDGNVPFVEDDKLGGQEPYGVSKAAAEMVVQAFRNAQETDSTMAVATARAGNVIGGGDWAEDRLVPDAMKAFGQGQALVVRNPGATRPWQYVLDPLCGYLLLAERLYQGEQWWRGAWNFGPGPDETISVADIADRLVDRWNERDDSPATWHMMAQDNAPYEAKTLAVDSGKARSHLGWEPRMPLDDALAETVGWYTALRAGADMDRLAAAMVAAYANP